MPLQVIAAEPGVVQSSGDVQHLATFFTGRLTDWCGAPKLFLSFPGCKLYERESRHGIACQLRPQPGSSEEPRPPASLRPHLCRPAIRGALAGCLALLDLPAAAQGGGPAGPALSAADAVGMMEAFAGHVFVRSLGQQDRALAFSLMDKAMAVRLRYKQ